MAKAKKRSSSKKSKGKVIGFPSKRKQRDVEGDHIRSLAPASAVRSFINEVISTKNATSEADQGLSTATKRATEQGVNVPAARIAARILSKAKQDGLKARVLWEDARYYLEDCTEFNRIAPAGMFTPEESGQKRSRKKKPEQQELPVDAPADPIQAQAEAEPEPMVTH